MRKHVFMVSVLCLLVSFTSCDTSGGSEDLVEEPPIEQVDPSNPQQPTDEEIANDSRLSSFDSAGVWWIRRPTKQRDLRLNIAEDDPIAGYCDKPGWSYLFYDDGAVIGYEPFPDRVDLMHAAVMITVEIWNRDHPNQQWGYINVPVPPPPPPDTSNDPILGKWEVCFCIDDGSIVWGPIVAEFDWNWEIWKSGGLNLDLEQYNRDHDPDAHIVWGTD